MTTRYDDLAAFLMRQGTATEADVALLASRALEGLGLQCPNCDLECAQPVLVVRRSEGGAPLSGHRCSDCKHFWAVAS